MFLPDLRVEVAFNAGVRTPAASRTWTDVSDYVELDRNITITGGRADERAACEANGLTLVLDNSDGRFTPERAASPYFPNVKLGRPIRVVAELPGGDKDLFLGFVDEWPVEWDDGTDATSYATVTASSRLALLGEGTELPSIIEEEYSLDAPLAHYTMGEPEESTRANNSTPTRQPPLTRAGTGADPVFGQGTGPGTDGLTAVTFAGGKWLQASLDPPAGDWTVECFLSTTTNSKSPFGFGGVTVFVQGLSGLLFVGTDNVSDASAVVADDGSTRHLAIRWTASTSLAELLVDGVVEASLTDAAAVHDGTLYVGNGIPNFPLDEPLPGNTLDPGTIAHVAVYDSALSDARLAAHAEAGLGGFAGELAAVRIDRYAGYADIPSAEVDSSAGIVPLSHIDITGKTFVDALRVVETTDGGVLFDGRDGRITYRDRESRYQAASAFTINAAAQQLDGGIRPVLDRSALLNDVTAKNLTGTLTASVTDAASILDHGRRAAEVELATDDDEEPFRAAARRVNLYAEPRPRVSSLAPVDILPLGDALIEALVAADVGTRFTVTGLPSQASASSREYFVEGYVDTIGPESWHRSFNVSDADLSSAWLLDSATRSQLGTTTTLG